MKTYIDCSKINDATSVQEIHALKGLYPNARTFFQVWRYSRARGWVQFPQSFTVETDAARFAENDESERYQFYTIVKINLPGWENKST